MTSHSVRRPRLSAAQARALATLRRLPPRPRRAVYRLIGELARVHGVR
jgi:hypothetical protein